MSFGTFYEINNDACSIFEGISSKSDWYDALGGIDLMNCDSCDAEEAIPAWELALKTETVPLSQIFQGNLRAESDENEDPNVIFINNVTVASITKEIEDKTKYYFNKLLSDVNCSDDIWLFDSMLQFFKNATAKNKAVVIIWSD